MRQVCVIVVLLVAAASALSPPDVRRGMEAMNAAVKEALSGRAFAAFATQHFQVQQSADISVECQTAAAAVQGAFAQCGPVPATPAKKEVLEAFCTANCTDNLRAAINNALSVCKSPADRAIFVAEQFEKALRGAQGVVDAICLKEGDDFCLSLLADLDFNFMTVTKEQLDGICTSCAHKLVMATAKIGGDLVQKAAGLAFFCQKIDDEYCLLKTREAIVAKTAMGDNVDYNKLAPLFCSDCFRATITKGAIVAELFPGVPDAAGMVAEYLQTFSLVCSKDESGKFCVGRMEGVRKYTESFAEQPCPQPSDITPNSTCDADCRGFITGVIGITGCCTRPFYTFSPEDTIVHWAEHTCGVTVPQTCRALRVKGKLVLRNLKFGYVQANLIPVQAAITRDLANFFDVMSSSIAIISITNTPNTPAGGFALQQAAGVTVNYEATPMDNAHANTIREKSLAATNAPLPSIASLPLAAREDPALPLSFDDADPKDIVVEGSAAGLKAGVAVAAAVVAAAVANLFF